MKSFVVNVVYGESLDSPIYSYSFYDKKDVLSFIKDTKLRADKLLHKYRRNFIDCVKFDYIGYDSIKVTVLGNLRANEIIYKGKVYSVNNFNFGISVLRIVKFSYNGGSDYGAERIVKVTDEDSEHLNGIDLAKNEQRSYLKSRISNLKELVF